MSVCTYLFLQSHYLLENERERGERSHAGLLVAGPLVPLEFFKLSFNTNVTLQAVSFMWHLMIFSLISKWDSLPCIPAQLSQCVSASKCLPKLIELFPERSKSSVLPFMKLKIYSTVLTTRVMDLNVVYTASAVDTQCSSLECSLHLGLGPQGGCREKKGYRKAGRRKEKERLQGLCSRLSVTVLHVAKWEPANWAGYIWPVQSFWKFERFYTKIEISGFSWESFSTGHTQPAFLHGNTIGWKMSSSCPFKTSVSSPAGSSPRSHPLGHNCFTSSQNHSLMLSARPLQACEFVTSSLKEALELRHM